MKWIVLFLIGLAGLAPKLSAEEEILLFAFFRDNGQRGTFLAYSEDGIRFLPLNQDHPIFPPANWSGQNLTRDPSILYHQGKFHAVWTSSWQGNIFGYAESADLIRWSDPVKAQPFSASLPDEEQPRNIWAPEIHWDPIHKDFAILFSSTLKKAKANSQGGHRIYLTRTVDGKTFSPAKLFFDQGFSVIDAFMVFDGKRWILVVKPEQAIQAGGKNLKLAFAPADLTKPWSPVSSPVVGPGSTVRPREMAEGPSLLQWKGNWLLYWDAFANGHYGLAVSTDLQTWTDRTADLKMPSHPRHGTIFRAPRSAVGFLQKR